MRRPDIVLYLNGLAVAVIELKRSSVEVADGVRQLITNQEEIFNKGFFSTVQLVLAGNDSQGLRYGTVGTPEQFFVRWKGLELAGTAKAPEADLSEGALLDRPLREMLRQGAAARPDPQLHDLRRRAEEGAAPAPVRGVKAAQERIARREGGVIWHTQGSGKSILMVLLAKWLLEHDPDARILVVTDRDELDKQIEGVMTNAGVIGAGRALAAHHLPRASSWRSSAPPQPRLLCALIHKFDPSRPERRPPPGHGPLLRVRGRVPPHPGRRHEQADEALAGGRHLHRLHRHAAAAQGQADDARRLRHLHPHLQVPRGAWPTA